MVHCCSGQLSREKYDIINDYAYSSRHVRWGGGGVCGEEDADEAYEAVVVVVGASTGGPVGGAGHDGEDGSECECGCSVREEGAGPW